MMTLTFVCEACGSTVSHYFSISESSIEFRIEPCDDCLQSSYNEGKDIGEEDGYEEGLAEGRSEGRAEGIDEGREEGHEDGYRMGYDEGFAAGQEDADGC